jgi:hypothetical protein
MFKKLFVALFVATVAFSSFFALSDSVNAQDYDYDYSYDYYDDTYYDDSDDLGEILAIWMVMIGVMACLMIPVYIYMAFALMTIANKVGEPNSWLAWIPIANLYLMVKVADENPWLMLLYFAGLIPFVGSLIVIGVNIYIWMKIAERRGFPNWVGVLIIVPLANLVVPGYIAWAEPSSPATPVTNSSETPKAKEVSADKVEG